MGTYRVQLCDAIGDMLCINFTEFNFNFCAYRCYCSPAENIFRHNIN